MADAVPIHRDYDFWVPAFEVKIAGREAKPTMLHDVLSVSYADSLDKLDSCELTLNNWDEVARDFKYVGRRTDRPEIEFKPGLPVELSLGYHDRGGLTRMLRGEVVAIANDFPAGGQPTVTVRVLSNLYKLHFKQATQVFENLTDTQIAREVLARMEQDLAARSSEAGNSVRLELVDSPDNATIEEPHAYIALINEYPIVFLMERARHNGYDIFVEESEEGVTRLHFHPPDRRRPPAYELVWGGSLISFKPTLKTKEQVSKVVVRGWDPVAKKAIEGVATWDKLKNRGLLKLAELSAADSALAGSEIVIADETVFTQTEADEKAIDHLTRLANDLVSGSGATVGLPELRAGSTVLIRRLGPPFEGRYMVTSSTHSIGDGGYAVQFEARMEEPEAPESGP